MKNTTSGAAYKQPLAFDASTKRRFDDNGFLHVDGCHITKEQVAPYYGFEIPDFERFGLDPKKIYYGYRSAEELQKGLSTFNGLPLLLHHHPESAEEPQKEYRVGSVGTSAVWNAPYIDNVLSITDKTGIKAVQDGTCRQISSAYQYDPDFTKGEFDGQAYDFVMRNIRGNHVALVEEGRAGPDVVVADAQIIHQPEGKKSVMLKLKNFFKGYAWDNDPMKDDVAEDDDNKVIKVKAIIESLGDVIPPEKLKELHSILDEMAEEEVVEEKVSEDEDEVKDPPVDPVDAIKEEDVIEKEDEGEAEDEAEEENFDEEKYEEETSEDEEPDPRAFIDANSAADEAWKNCGIDSDDPDVKAAFAKGFSWGMKDGEKNGERAEKFKMAHDAAINSAIDRATKNLEAQFEAADEVSRVIGKVKATAFDSVPDIYMHALKEMGIASSAYNKASAKDVFNILVKQREVQMAQDANLVESKSYTGAFAGLNDIK